MDKDLDLKPRAPDCTILLKVSLEHRTAELPLPSSQSEMDRALHAVGADIWSEVSLRCLDCKVPRLIDAKDHAESIIQINRLARKLAEMKPADLTKYKALLEAVGCSDLDRAELLADTLDNYLFSPRLRSPVDMAKGDLAVILPEPEAEILTPYLDLERYGQALIQDCGGVLTDYGLIERKDGQPVQTLEQQPRRGGMEMT